VFKCFREDNEIVLLIFVVSRSKAGRGIMAEGRPLVAVRVSGDWHPQLIKGKTQLVCSKPEKCYGNEP